jgi:hypothetical protein
VPFFWVFLPIVVLLVYHVPLLAGRLVHYDDPILIEPLATMTTPAQWIDRFRDHQIWDIQPVRDLSLWLDARATALIGHETYHLTNLVIWTTCCFLLYRLLVFVSGKPRLSSALALLFAVWPTFVTSVALASSRRHLLALVFILGATLCFLRRAGAARIWILYTLSIFSHGITILWPLWCWTWMLLDRRKDWKTRPSQVLTDTLPLVPCFLMAVVCAALTFGYYQHQFLIVSGKDAFYGSPEPGDVILALGRAFFQLLIPVKFALAYDRGALVNLLGLPLGIGGLAWVKSRLGWAPLLRWLPLMVAAFIPALTRNIFIVDLYLLVPGVVLFLLASLCLPEISKAPRRIQAAALVPVLLVGLRSASLAAQTTSALDLWEASYRSEPNLFTEATYAFYLFDRDPQAATALVDDLRARRCGEKPCYVAAALGAYYSPPPGISQEAALKGMAANLYFGDLVYAAFLFKNGRGAEADPLLDSLYKDPIFVRLFASVDNGLVGEIRRGCEGKASSGCQRFLAKHRTVMRYY